MATIKSYSDLQQSKVLAEILPLESADMKILPFNEREYRIVPINDIAVCGKEDEIYAWSLAALLNVLPPIEGFRPIIDLDINLIRYEGNYRDKLCFNENNLIDACYEMIIKLKEMNLL